jgi:hypothetical protein
MLTLVPISTYEGCRDLAEAGDREPQRGETTKKANKLKQTPNRLNGPFTDEDLNEQFRLPRFRQNNGTPLF